LEPDGRNTNRKCSMTTKLSDLCQHGGVKSA
jgi:hypothetical protein